MSSFSVSRNNSDLQGSGLNDLMSLTVQRTPVPVVTDELKQRYQGQLVAFSLEDGSAKWGDAGAAKTRRELSAKMSPLQCSKDYFVHAIE